MGKRTPQSPPPLIAIPPPDPALNSKTQPREVVLGCRVTDQATARTCRLPYGTVGFNAHPLTTPAAGDIKYGEMVKTPCQRSSSATRTKRDCLTVLLQYIGC